MKKLIYLSIFFVCAFACTKKEFDTTVNGEAIIADKFKIIGPATNTNLVLNSATPTATVEISWTAAEKGVSAAIIYKWIAALKSTGNLNTPILELASNNLGKDTKLTLSQKQIDDALASKGIAAGVKTDFIWAIVAENGSTQVRSAEVFNITLTRFANGTSPFILLGPSSSTIPLATDPGSTTNTIKFNWTKSIPGTGSPAVTYKVLFSLDGNFNAPLFSATSDNAGVDTVRTITYKAMSDSLNKYGQTNLSQASALKWTVEAVSGTWKQRASYINDLVIVREVRLYMPGNYQSASAGAGTDWTPANAPELIRDLRPGALNDIYYTYVYLTAGTQFKVTQGRAWDVNFGPSTNVTGSAGNLTLGSSDNFSITSTGVYRISVNRSTLTYDVRLGRMGFVGGAIPGNNWTPGNTFIDPNSQMTLVKRDQFIGINDFNTGGWKMIDNNNWNSGDVNITNNRSYGSLGNGSGDGSDLVINADNIPDVTTAGRYRVIWDGTNPNSIKYLFNSAAQMRVVGNGMDVAGVNDWDPPTSPQMTYNGNGRWQITLSLKANKEIKFVAGGAWGAFDYEDDGAGIGAGVRKLKWNGGDNFKTPTTAGTYTIILDEKAGTLSIN